jgi:hypothetical protein
VPGIVGLLGVSGEQVILQTSDGLRAFKHATGEPVWERELAAMHPASACDGRVLVATHPKAKEGNKLLTRLTWIDGATGEILAEQDVAGLEADDPRLGLLIPYQAKLWTFFGQGQTDPSRDLVELIRK